VASSPTQLGQSAAGLHRLNPPNWPVLSPAPASGVLEVSPTLGVKLPGGKNLNLIPRQLWHPWSPACAMRAEATSPFHAAFHPHQFELAQSDRAMVRRTQPEGRAARRLSQRARTTTRHRRVSHRVERSFCTFRLDRQRRLHLRENRPRPPTTRTARAWLQSTQALLFHCDQPRTRT
jgi:hypothetical protein